MRSFKNITVYCGSADEIKPVYTLAARQLGKLLADKGIRLVYGGGKTGLMGTIADSVLTHGGSVTGIVPHNLNHSHLIHAGLTSVELSTDIQARQRRMHDLADASIAMPGGFGTFYELLESITWAQIGLHTKPIGLLNTAGYFDPLLVLVEHAINEGFIYPEHNRLFCVSESPAELLEQLEKYAPPDRLERWINREKPENEFKHND